MALMKHREPNQVLWRGVRPGHDGTQVWKEGQLEGVGTLLIYTVPALNTFFLSYFHVTSRLDVAAGCSSWLSIYDAVPALQCHIVRHIFDLAGQIDSCAALLFPIEVPTGYLIQLESNNAGLDITASFFGWTQPN